METNVDAVYTMKDGRVNFILNDKGYRDLSGVLMKGRADYCLVTLDPAWGGNDWRMPDGRCVALLSVNGCGEIRWRLFAGRGWQGDDGAEEAIAHFNLTKI